MISTFPLNKEISLESAIYLAATYLKTIKLDRWPDDTWLKISSNWDLNIYLNDGDPSADIYPIVQEDGFDVTLTLEPASCLCNFCSENIPVTILYLK